MIRSIKCSGRYSLPKRTHLASIKGSCSGNLWFTNLGLILCHSPPARWGLLDFMSDARLLLLVVLLPPFFLPPSLLPRRTSSASSWLQWAWPYFICQPLIAVILAGPHLPALDRSGRRRTSSASSGSQWASPDLDRTSTAKNKAI